MLSRLCSIQMVACRDFTHGVYPDAESVGGQKLAFHDFRPPDSPSGVRLYAHPAFC